MQSKDVANLAYTGLPDRADPEMMIKRALRGPSQKVISRLTRLGKVPGWDCFPEAPRGALEADLLGGAATRRGRLEGEPGPLGPTLRLQPLSSTPLGPVQVAMARSRAFWSFQPLMKSPCSPYPVGSPMAYTSLLQSEKAEVVKKNSKNTPRMATGATAGRHRCCNLQRQGQAIWGSGYVSFVANRQIRSGVRDATLSEDLGIG